MNFRYFPAPSAINIKKGQKVRFNATVAELVDVADLKSVVLTGVPVRVRPVVLIRLIILSAYINFAPTSASSERSPRVNATCAVKGWSLKRLRV